MKITSRKLLNRTGLIGIADRLLANSVCSKNTVVILGFWRSGTTYLLELLEQTLRARTVFEPFHEAVPAARKYHQDAQFLTPRGPVTQMYPYIPAHSDRSDLDQFLYSILTGQVSNRWTRRNRAPGNLLSTKLLVKLVRGNLIAGYLSRRFGVKIIMIVRHPAAVIASIIRSPGGDKALQAVLGDASFEQVLPGDSVHADHPELWPQIKIDNADVVSRIARIHALLHILPLSQNEGEEGKMHICTYEGLLLDQERELKRMNTFLAADPGETWSLKALKKPSSTTKAERIKISTQARCTGWKQELTADQIKNIDLVVSSAGGHYAELIRSIEVMGMGGHAQKT